MSTLKVSGKRLSLPKVSDSGWQFDHRPGGWIIATHSTDATRYRFKIEQIRGKLSFTTRLHSGLGELQKEASGTARGQASAASIEADLTAQFPGKVRKILVTSGAAVKEGESLLLVEAMKMEFAIKAPVSGIVTRLLVKEGQQLSPGDRFLEFAAESKKDDA
jgi:biotin carboxyl carrier protein